MRAADPVYTAMPLDQSHRIPRQVVVHDISALLQVHAFCQYVGRYHDVKFVAGARWRFGGFWDETEDSFFTAYSHCGFIALHAYKPASEGLERYVFIESFLQVFHNPVNRI